MESTWKLTRSTTIQSLPLYKSRSVLSNHSFLIVSVICSFLITRYQIMFKFFRKSRVSHQVILLVYSNGRKFEGKQGLTFEGQKRAIQITSSISYDTLKTIMGAKLKLQPHQIISSITYRFPISQRTYTDLEIHDTEDVECMISAAEKHSHVNVLEVYVEIDVLPVATSKITSNNAENTIGLSKDDEDRSIKDEDGGGLSNDESSDAEVVVDLNANSSNVAGENREEAGEEDSSHTGCSLIPQPQSWRYHVFVNFRGGDTRMGFTDHLFTSLERKGIITYRDDKNLERGEEISTGLIQAIEESMIAVTIFSRNYAYSTWCLEELQKILECKNRLNQIVVPIFYNVEPSDLRHQRNTFEEAFMKHEIRFGDKVLGWRSALSQVTSFSGFSSRDQPEAAFVDLITDYIHKLVMRRLPSCTENIALRLEEVIRQLDIGLKDVRLAYMGHGWHK